jgi:hypothetical protein
MIRKTALILLFCFVSIAFLNSQSVQSTADLFKSTDQIQQPSGQLNIYQNPALDTLINRYISANRNIEARNGGNTGIEGFRIQIFNSSERNAKTESAKVRADFINQFPDVVTYLVFAEPAWYKVRVGNFRSRTEATKLFLTISRKFPNADLVPDIISIPDLNKK